MGSKASPHCFTADPSLNGAFIHNLNCSPASRFASQAQHLLNAADHYALARLRAICERFLARGLAADNAAFTLTLADQHHAVGLRQAALRFIAANTAAVVATEGWAHLMSARPLLAQEVIVTMAGGGAAGSGGAPGGADGAEGSGRGGTKRGRDEEQGGAGGGD